MTEWRAVLGFENDYEASDQGEVRRSSDGIATHAGKMRKPSQRGDYLQFTFCVDNVLKTISAHRVIWSAFHGPIPKKMQINHKNGIKTDNRLCNLEICTCSENHRHAFDVLGRGYSEPPHWRGSAHPRSVLDESQVREIRRLYAARSFNQVTLAEMFGTDQTNISDIVRLKTWTHV